MTEFEDFLNAENYIFKKKEMCEREIFERKERSVQLLLIIFGFVLSYSWKSKVLDGALPILFFMFTISILLYYSVLPSCFVYGGEYRKIARSLAKITAASFSFVLVLVFISNSNVTEYSWDSLFLLCSLLLSICVFILRLLYV